MIISLFFYLFSLVIVSCAVMVISSRNPVHSVLFLILAFFNSGALFVMLGAEFLAMMLVIVYVGAVAVLFLFVVMMLNINYSQIKDGFQKYYPIGSLIGLILFAQIVLGILTLLFGAQIYLASMHQISSIFLISSSVYFLYLNSNTN